MVKPIVGLKVCLFDDVAEIRAGFSSQYARMWSLGVDFTTRRSRVESESPGVDRSKTCEHVFKLSTRMQLTLSPNRHGMKDHLEHPVHLQRAVAQGC